MPLPHLQELIHKFEVGPGGRVVRLVLVALTVLLVWVGYNWRSYRNLSSPEAMDACQLGRNLAEGRGFSTFVVRPFSVYLLENHRRADTNAPAAPLSSPDRVDYHPDLSNPPAYPLLLAGLMKVLPFNYEVTTTRPFWSSGGRFMRYQPEMIIALVNQALFLITVVLVFKLARRLFDAEVAWLSAAILLGTELMWRFTVSGLPTIFLMLIFVGLAWVVVIIEQELREPKLGEGQLLLLAGAAGALAGVGMLSRYSFGMILLPLLAFLMALGGARRVRLALLVLLGFGLLVGPWVTRNYLLSGTPFGTAGYVALADTFLFPDYRLERSLNPDLGSRAVMIAMGQKFFGNLASIIQTDLPKISGSWVSAFFLAGLMVLFRNPATSRLRFFLLGSLLALMLAQPLIQTESTKAAPEVNAGNLLVVLAPLIIIYGVAMFMLLLDQLPLPSQQLRWIPSILFVVLACLPMLFKYLPPARHPVAFPPYNPPLIQLVGSWMKPHEVIMSDLPWAVAWYGQRQSAWLTLNATPEPGKISPEDMLTLHRLHGPIRALYLTHATLDKPFINGIQGTEVSWGNLVLQIIETRAVPTDFPLPRSPAGTGDALELGILNGRLILTDWERWKAPR